METKILWRNYIYRVAILLSLFSFILSPACTAKKEEPTPEKIKPSLSLSSQAFREGEKIPVKYTGQGQDISPPLTWSEAPKETQAFVLIMDDPDAPGGIFTHWVLFNLPPGTRELPEAEPRETQLPGGALQGKNDFGNIGYGGPSPPPGRPHHYRFTLYAVDRTLELKAGATKEQVLRAVEGHILAQGQLIGTYER